MNARQGGFLISKIKNIGGRKFDKILQEKNIDAFNGALAKTTLSAMLTRMDEQGLIAMEESLTDKRSVCISLTEKAAALKEEYDAVTREIEDIYYKGFTDSEVEQFENYLKRILANLGDK